MSSLARTAATCNRSASCLASLDGSAPRLPWKTSCEWSPFTPRMNRLSRAKPYGLHGGDRTSTLPKRLMLDVVEKSLRRTTAHRFKRQTGHLVAPIS